MRPAAAMLSASYVTYPSAQVYKYAFCYQTKKWSKSVIVVQIDRVMFAEGNLRRAYRMRDLTSPEGKDQYVAKVSKDKNEDIQVSPAHKY